MTHVTIPPMDTPLSYTASASQTVFAITFPFWSADDIVVVVDGVVLDPSDFVVAGSSLQDGSPVTGAYGSGTVTLNAACAGGETVVLDRLIDPERLTDLSPTGPFNTDTVNSDLDKLTARDQDLFRGLLRSLRTVPGEALNALPKAADRALGTLGFDVVGQPTVFAHTLSNVIASTFGAALVAAVSAHAAQAVLGFDLSTGFEVGTGSPTVTDNTAIRLVGQIHSHPAGGDHGFRDDSTDDSTTGFLGRASFDTVAVISGAAHWNHDNGYQARQVFSGSGLIDGMNGYTANMTVTNGTADYVVSGMHSYDVQVTGPGVVPQQFGWYCEDLHSAVTNFVFATVGAAIGVINGRLQSNTRIDAPTMRLTAAGFVARYGQVPTLDTNGEFLANPFTIINGYVDMAAASGGALGLQRSTTTQRNAMTPRNGDMTYDTTLDTFMGRIAGAWKTFTLA